MDSIKDDILMHYGMPKRSGRYPWGSGEDPYQHSGDFLARVDSLKREGLSEADIAKAIGLTTTQLRVQKSLANDERRSLQVARAKSLREDGKTLDEIAKIMGFNNDSSVRSLLNVESEAKMKMAKATADFLKEQVDTKGMIDVGTGVEREMPFGNISKEKLNQALYMLEREGYVVYGGGVPQVTNPGKQTNIKVLCPPGTEHKDIYNYENIHSVADYITYDGGDTFKPAFVYPASMDSKRMKVRYAEEGGIDKDGVIELRRGVPDLDLGNANYAQVRILVDGTHYMKGMAVYSDDLPKGVDVIFNTNKPKGTPALGDKKNSVLKLIKDDPDNPFGSLIKEHGGQSYYVDKDGNEKLSLINKRAEEGDWGSWSDHLSSQFLSKQPLPLIKKQLNMSAADKQAEYDEICSLTNPTVKKAMLKSFADDCDAASVHLKAAALPRQKYQVILAIPSMKDNEVYAPNYKDGEQVALVRYPHGGRFEIPILTVNNRQKEAIKVIGKTPADAIGINAKVASQLSGADFDGDTVMVIPTGGKIKIAAESPLKALEGFDPKMQYGGKEEGTFKVMKNTQTEMGKVSNLITDMTLKGANQEEIAKAVKHSMVVIDAEKHKLDYKQSEIDNDIAALKKKWQGTYDENGRYHEGAATLISRASSETSVLKRKGSPIIDKETGEQSWKEVYEEYVDPKTGKTKVRMQASTKMAEVKDAHKLSSGTPQEELYADYANKMKSLANQARKEMLSTGKIQYSSEAKAKYIRECESLDSKLNMALKNAPRERMAQIIANAEVKAKRQDNPDMSKGEIKKTGQQALSRARASVGAKRTPIKIEDREWEAIQAGAISESKLSQIINHVDADELRQRATPRSSTTMSSAKINRMKAYQASGYTTSQIAEMLGVSSSTVSKYLRGKE